FSPNTIVKFCKIFRNLVINTLTEEDEIIGSDKIICEIDKRYSKLEELEIKHVHINYSKRNIEYLKRKIHSNTIEGTWVALKKFIPKYNRRKDKIKLYLKEFI
ncbi:7152_t:CDS:2, partial [Scutellospora calospora]